LRLQSAWTRAAAVIPVRLFAGAACVVAAIVAGAATAAALVAFAVGTFAVAFAALNDPRSRALQGSVEPLDAPASAVVDPTWRHAVAASFPSTVGVTALAAIALPLQPVLSALLGGAAAGLGLAALAALPRIDRTLLIEPRSRAVYRRQPG
jgi:hypothetical protein